MTTAKEIRKPLENQLSDDEVKSLKEIYALVEGSGILDREDYMPQATGSNVPKWKRNTRNVLQHWIKVGKIARVSRAHYRMKRAFR
jgi:hypothetical protein